MQVTQQVFVAEECVKSAYNKFEAESNFRREVEKTLRSVKEEKSQLAEKLKTSEHYRQSALAGLKTTEAEAKVQRKRLFTTELNLARGTPCIWPKPWSNPSFSQSIWTPLGG